MVGVGMLGQNLSFTSVDGSGNMRYVWRDRADGGLYGLKGGSNIIPYSAVGIGAIDATGAAVDSPNDPSAIEIHFNAYTTDGALWWGYLGLSPWGGKINWIPGPNPNLSAGEKEDRRVDPNIYEEVDPTDARKFGPTFAGMAKKTK